MRCFLIAAFVLINHSPLCAQTKITPTPPEGVLPLGADGKPCAGVKLYLWTNAVKKQADMAVQATTGDDGRFRPRVARDPGRPRPGRADGGHGGGEQQDQAVAPGGRCWQAHVGGLRPGQVLGRGRATSSPGSR